MTYFQTDRMGPAAAVAILLAGCHLLTIGDRELGDGIGGAGGDVETRCGDTNDCPDASGECVAPTCVAMRCEEVPLAEATTCSLGVCDGDGACVECTQHGHCPPADYCQDNSCEPREAVGIPCGGDRACLSGFCADGVCCDAACDSDCEACAFDKTGVDDGTCAPTTALSDPDGECAMGTLCNGCGECESGIPSWGATAGDDTFLQSCLRMAAHDDFAYAVGQFAGEMTLDGPMTAVSGGPDAFLTKLNSAGVHEWSRHFGDTMSRSTLEQIAADVAVDSDGSAIVVGRMRGSVDFGNSTEVKSAESWGIFVLEVNSSGVTQWARLFDGTSTEQGRVVATSASDEIAIGGLYVLDPIQFGSQPALPGAAGISGFVAKLSSTGNPLWSVGFEADESNERVFINDIEFDSAGDVWVVGQFRSLNDMGVIDFGDGVVDPDGQDGVVLKLDGVTGATLLRHTLSSAGDDSIRSLVIDRDDNVTIAGLYGAEATPSWNPSNVLPHGGGEDSFVTQLSNAGAHLWTNSFPAAHDQFFRHLGLTSTDRIVLVASQQGTVNYGGCDLVAETTTRDGAWVAFEANGDHAFSHVFGAAEDQVVQGVAINASDRIFMCGFAAGTFNFGPTLITTGNVGLETEALFLSATP